MEGNTFFKTVRRLAGRIPFIRRLYFRAHKFYRAYVSDRPDWWDPSWAVCKPGEIAPGVEMIIFSKNRACQLDQLIRSLLEYLEELDLFNITVIYVADNDNFKEGYKIVQQQFRFSTFIEQRSDQTIGQQIQDIMDISKKELICMLVDDDIMIRKLSLHSPQFRTFRTDLSISSLSIRLSRLITYCQPLAVPERPPHISKNNVFHWYTTPVWRLVRDVSRKLGQHELGAGDWSISMSMDGNFFRLTEFREYFRHLPEMKRFGDVEITMTRTPIPKEYGICFDEAKLINIPFNSVREDYKYPNMEVDPQHLNELFIRGRRLDYSHLRSINSSTCHLEMVPRWIEGPPQA